MLQSKSLKFYHPLTSLHLPYVNSQKVVFYEDMGSVNVPLTLLSIYSSKTLRKAARFSYSRASWEKTVCSSNDKQQSISYLLQWSHRTTKLPLRTWRAYLFRRIFHRLYGMFEVWIKVIYRGDLNNPNAKQGTETTAFCRRIYRKNKSAWKKTECARLMRKKNMDRQLWEQMKHFKYWCLISFRKWICRKSE